MFALTLAAHRRPTLTPARAGQLLTTIYEALEVIDVFVTADDSWEDRFESADPQLVDEIDASRLERIWPDRDVHVLTICGRTSARYLHILFDRRPEPRELCAVLSLESLRIGLGFDLGHPSTNSGATDGGNLS